MRMARDQWPKNSHNKMITGIGTPSSQSKIPRPMISSIFFNRRENAEEQAGFRQRKGLTVSGISTRPTVPNISRDFSEAAP
jgi:hypothetical protein